MNANGVRKVKENERCRERGRENLCERETECKVACLSFHLPIILISDWYVIH